MKRMITVTAWLMAMVLQVSAAKVVCIGLNQPEGYKALKCAENDAAKLAGTLQEQGHEAVLLVGGDATREKVLAALADKTAIVYFAGHGEKDRVILADGPLMVRELAERCSFAMLDCCYTGGGLQESGATRILAAAQYEAFESDGHGLFTKYLLRWLGDGRSFADDSMIEFITRGIRHETGGWQKPVLGYA